MRKANSNRTFLRKENGSSELGKRIIFFFLLQIVLNTFIIAKQMCCHQILKYSRATYWHFYHAYNTTKNIEERKRKEKKQITFYIFCG